MARNASGVCVCATSQLAGRQRYAKPYTLETDSSRNEFHGGQLGFQEGRRGLPVPVRPIILCSRITTNDLENLEFIK